MSADIQSVAQEIDELGNTHVRDDIAQEMIASGEFAQVDIGDEVAGFTPLSRSNTNHTTT